MDYRDNANGSTQWNLAPALRLQYQVERHLLFTEGGMFFYRTDYPDLGSNDLKVYFAYLGYRYTY